VEYGAILELARDHLDAERPNRPRQLLLQVATTPAMMRAQTTLGRLLPGGRIPGFVSRLVSGELPEVDKPQPQSLAKLPPLPSGLPSRGEVDLLEGCAMRVLFPRVHQATRRLLARIGYSVRTASGACCGALHAHNGDLDGARRRARELIAALPGDRPIIINSAGCGSTIKEYAHLLDGDETGRSFAARAMDLSEFLLQEGMVDHLAQADRLQGRRVTYHDACHLAHGQRVWDAPRTLIRAIPGVEYAELPEADTCCGSAGIYNITQPAMARRLLDRKVGNIAHTDAEIVALGNPGCHAWMAQGVRERFGDRRHVLHTAELLEAAFTGLDAFR
jgi:glycolate oxidase iron-sulfur subunit